VIVPVNEKHKTSAESIVNRFAAERRCIVDFDLTRAQEMIRKEVRRFAQSEIAPVAMELDEAELFPDLTRENG
jgi:precorrin-2 methylase